MGRTVKTGKFRAAYLDAFESGLLAEMMRYIAQDLSLNTYVNIMPQYRPCGKAVEHDGLDRAPTQDAYTAAVRTAEAEGIHRLDKRRGVFMVF